MNVPFAGLQSLVLFTQYKTVTCFFIWTLSIITNEHMGYDTASPQESGEGAFQDKASAIHKWVAMQMLLEVTCYFSSQGCPQLEMVLLELPLCPSVHKQI